jgi:hypothetical protein
MKQSLLCCTAGEDLIHKVNELFESSYWLQYLHMFHNCCNYCTFFSAVQLYCDNIHPLLISITQLLALI